MANTYHNESIEVANKFIKTLCFVDDQPFFNESEDPVNEDVDHRLNASLVTKAFAPKGKSCSFYQYKAESEEADIVTLATNTDVSVIDWRIIILKENSSMIVDPSVVIANSDEDDEKDVEEKESRGKYALRLLERIIQGRHESPKLIIIFTAEYEFESVYNPVKEKLIELGIAYETDAEQLWFQTEKFRISIYFKTSPNRHFSEIVQSKMLDISELPKYVNDEFAYLASGFVLNAAIQSIAAVRANTFHLLDSYNKNLDSAYLTHKSLLPSPDDAEDQLIELIGSDIKAILKSEGIASYLRSNLLQKYLDSTFTNQTYPFTIPNSDKMVDIGIPNEITGSTLKSVVTNGVEKTFLKNDQPNDQRILFSKNCHKNLADTFAESPEEGNQSNINFATITTISSKYNSRHCALTLGTIVKEERGNNYWLCIQPKCDSVRIITQKRSFAFLKLSKAESSNFHIVLKGEESIFLKVNYQIHNSALIDFKLNGNSSICATLEQDGLMKYDRWDNKKMIWVAELKNDFAQSIINNFSSQLSRVGLDLSEWLRRSIN